MNAQSAQTAFATLSEKELEVLRLLAAGHTVKSIAQRLGRSEASINERLREARRKTSMGSSRELARLVDAQKNWDKFPDLSPSGFGVESLVQPHDAGRKRSKGMTMLIFATPFAVIGLALAAANSTDQAKPPQIAHAAAPRQTPLIGTWSLDVSRIPPEERPREVTIDFSEATKGAWTTKVRIVAPDGGVMQAESTAAFDGKAVPVSGNMPFIDSVSLRHPSPGTLVMTLSKDGAPVSTRVYTVVNSGRSMTETIIWAGQNVPKLETTYFNRVD